MAALAHHLALLHHHDALEPLDGGEAVRDDDGGAAHHQIGQPGLHQPFILGIQRAGRLVQQQQRRIAQDGAGDRQALALAAGQRHAALADQGVETLRQTFR